MAKAKKGYIFSARIVDIESAKWMRQCPGCENGITLSGKEPVAERTSKKRLAERIMWNRYSCHGFRRRQRNVFIRISEELDGFSEENRTGFGD